MTSEEMFFSKLNDKRFQKMLEIYLVLEKETERLSDCQIVTGILLCLPFLLPPLHFSFRTRDKKLREELEEDHGPTDTAETSRSL